MSLLLACVAGLSVACGFLGRQVWRLERERARLEDAWDSSRQDAAEAYRMLRLALKEPPETIPFKLPQDQPPRHN